MNQKLRNAIEAFKRDTPEAKDWSDREIVEALLLILSTEPDSGSNTPGGGRTASRSSASDGQTEALSESLI